jgi:hypothetical protein
MVDLRNKLLMYKRITLDILLLCVLPELVLVRGSEDDSNKRLWKVRWVCTEVSTFAERSS